MTNAPLCRAAAFAYRVFAFALVAMPLAAQTSARQIQAQTAQVPSRASLQSAIVAMNDRSRESDAVSALTATMHDSATLLLDGAPILRGRSAITRALAAQPALTKSRLHFAPQLVELSGDGTLGVSWGVLIVRAADTANAPLRTTRYLSAWSHDAAGWRLVAFAFLAPVYEGATVVPRDLAPVVQAIQPRGTPFAAADSAFAVMAATSNAPRAFGAFAAPDAVIFPGDGIAVGPQNIEARMQASGAGALRWEWRPRVANGSADGTLGFTVGEAIIRSAAGTGAPVYSKYLSLWRRLPDGSIRFLSDGGNSRPAPAP